jgi:periplasmic protein TonB
MGDQIAPLEIDTQGNIPTMASAPLSANHPSGNEHPSRSPRRKIESLMYVDLGQQNGGFPINVSEGGMAFHGVQPMTRDQVLQIKFKLPGHSKSVESAAQIAWLNKLGKGGGLRFIDLPEGALRLIKEWLSPQTSLGDPANSVSVPHPPAARKISTPAPVIAAHRPGHSPAKTTSRNVAASLAMVAAAKGNPAASQLATPVRSINSARVSGFRDPLLMTENRNPWSTAFWVALITSLVIVAIFSVSSSQFDFHWNLQFPAWITNPAHPSSERATPAAPRFSYEMQTADVPPSDPAESESAPSVAAQPSMETQDSSEGPATPERATEVPRPVKKALPLKIKSPRVRPEKMGTNAKPVTPRRLVKSPAAEIAPPTLELQAKSELSPQFPAPVLELPATAPLFSPAPIASAQPSSKFEAAQLITRKSPVYPAAAYGAGLSGSVELHFIIGADGRVHNVTVVKGNPLLARAAIQAIQAWHYQPARHDAVPVESESSMVFVFKSN